MKIGKIITLINIVSLFFVSCNSLDDENKINETPNKKQSFTVVVESVGELFTGGEGVKRLVPERHPITNVTPSQTFDKLSIIIVEYQSPAKVVYKKTIENWSNPNNKSSIPWSTEDGQGRYATVFLTGNECLEEGKVYMAYVIGYQTGTYGGYEPFKDINIGDSFNRTELVTIQKDGYAEEIFAGAEIFFVQNGLILSKLSDKAEVQHGLLVARRQVAGTFGFFTHIPVEMNGNKVARLRLVATKRNRKIIFGGFRGIDDSFDFHKNNVINGMESSMDYDCILAGGNEKNAFVVYDIDLSKWYPGNKENSLLPLDINNDGYLDALDSNWKTDEEAYPNSMISLPKGTVFGDSFLASVAMMPEDIEKSYPTFQLQLLDASYNVIRYWNLALDNYDMENEERTLVSLPDGEEGRAVITVLDNIDTEKCFSIVRNHLYTIGDKLLPQDSGAEVPLDLGAADELVMNAIHQWQIHNSIIFN